MHGSTENQRAAEAVQAVPPPIPRLQPGTFGPFALNVATCDDTVVIQLVSTLVLPADQAESVVAALQAAIGQAKAGGPMIQIAGVIPPVPPIIASGRPHRR